MAAELELITVRDWLRYAVSRFNAAGLVYGHGTATALDEAAYLILHTLHLPIDQLDPWLDARLRRRRAGASADDHREAHRHPQAGPLPDERSLGRRAIPSMSTSG